MSRPFSQRNSTRLRTIVSLVLLRWLKGLLIALQYRNKAAQGEIDRK